MCLCYFIGVGTWKCFYFEKMGLGENMAEVRKRVVEDKYNTSSIKKKKTEKKKVTKEKMMKNEDKKVEKQSLFVRFRIFCNGVKSEFKKVHWTSKKDMVKYSVACIIFIIFCSLFFYLIDILFALFQSLFA